MDALFSDTLTRLFTHQFSPAAIRAIESGGSTLPSWSALEESGFLDVLLPEEANGAGLRLPEAFPLFLSAGYHAVPLPYAQTAMARAWLHAAGVAPPRGAIAIAGFETRQQGTALEMQSVSFGRVADWILTAVNDRHMLLPVSAARRTADHGHGSLLANLAWDKLPAAALDITAGSEPAISLGGLAAASHAPLLAGAANRVLDMTLAYANERVQFGKHIGRFQAVQSQVSAMAERVFAARMAAQLACQSSDWAPCGLTAAVGKSRCSEAACLIADIGHAVHGAIGITEEYNLQLYTRRLREWRNTAGTELFWNMQIGAGLLQASEHTSLSFICDALAPTAA